MSCSNVACATRAPSTGPATPSRVQGRWWVAGRLLNIERQAYPGAAYSSGIPRRFAPLAACTGGQAVDTRIDPTGTAGRATAPVRPAPGPWLVSARVDVGSVFALGAAWSAL